MLQAGYSNSLKDFESADTGAVVDALKKYVPDADQSQIRAWRDSIPVLKRAIESLRTSSPTVYESGAVVLEYTVPLESRRIDAVLLLPGCTLVVEFKGKSQVFQADIDQAAAYARDLRAYHRECAAVQVRCVLVLTQYRGGASVSGNVDIIGPEDFSAYIEKSSQLMQSVTAMDRFLSPDAYQPLPSLIKAARELFKSGSLRRVHRASGATDPTLKACSEIVHVTARKKRRALILICGIPGAGKTLVGLQLAHAKFLDDLAVGRGSGEKPSAAAVFLSGNGPLVEVLQYELQTAGGDGKAFVRGVHEYVRTFTASVDRVPPQHILIYDEAQRAFDALQVAAKHKDLPAAFLGLSEPELFVRFAERVPEWCVVVGLIGSGQEIHIGEEAGLGQWRSAIEKSQSPESWDVYVPNVQDVAQLFSGMPRMEHNAALQLSVEIRFHLATCLYQFVSHVLDGDASAAKLLSEELKLSDYNLRLTHDLGKAKAYLWNRYDENRDARFGMVASSKDKQLAEHGIPKGFKSRGEVGAGRFGRWYAEGRDRPESCTQLETVATEFGVQGLELDACLLAWGSDFVRKDGEWSNQYAAGYREVHRIQDAQALRKNAYRVLLTRGRDGCVIFVPPIADRMRETYGYLRDCGFTELS